MDTVKILETIVKKLEAERGTWTGNSRAIIESATNDTLAFAKSSLKKAKKEQEKKIAEDHARYFYTHVVK